MSLYFLVFRFELVQFQFQYCFILVQAGLQGPHETICRGIAAGTLTVTLLCRGVNISLDVNISQCELT